MQEIGTWCDLLIYLLNNSMKIITSTETQTDFFKAITVLRIIISNMKTDIADQSKEERKTFLQNKKMFLVMLKCCLKKEES